MSGNAGRMKESLIRLYSSEWRDFAESEILGKSHWKRNAGGMNPARHKPRSAPALSAPAAHAARFQEICFGLEYPASSWFMNRVEYLLKRRNWYFPSSDF